MGELEVLVVEVSELGNEGLSASVYDTRDDEDVAQHLIAGKDPVDNGKEAEWKNEMDELLSGGELLGYVDHELRCASVAYHEEAVQKSGERFERESQYVLVSDPSSTTVKISHTPEDKEFRVLVSGDGRLKFAKTYTYSDLCVTPIPELHDS